MRRAALDVRIEAEYAAVDRRLALLRERLRAFERTVRAVRAKAAEGMQPHEARAFQVGQQFAERGRFVCPLSCPGRPASDLALWPSGASEGEWRPTIREGREPGQWTRRWWAQRERSRIDRPPRRKPEGR